MDVERLRRLLYESEGDALDFKGAPYAFDDADDDTRSELLKDILGFANSWRRADAYILIGVKEVRSGCAEVVGIPEGDHLRDHTLQQFVNSRTNRPVLFNYRSLVVDGMQVGVIEIRNQERPVYLKRDFGKLRKNEVYVRRGSSTDPQKPAEPDEIARMGDRSSGKSAVLDIALAHHQRRGPAGTDVSWACENCALPDPESIPDLIDKSSTRWPHVVTSTIHFANRDYYREFAEYEQFRRWFIGFRLWVKNVGETPATRVRLEIIIPESSDYMLVDASDVVERPRVRFDPAAMVSLPERLASALGRSPGALSLSRSSEGAMIGVEFGDIQPGREVHSEVVYIGKRTSGRVEMSGLAFADNLQEPLSIKLTADIAVEHSSLSVEEITEIALSERTDESDIS
ncbi:MAG: ATP-binding protein [Phycisphaeraceae bacterium]|nr:ATP-binding protein [Phycisphaerales bacterium]MCB9842491.1 ATP-binding protein [Phycisphaeraceae bacterium]